MATGRVPTTANSPLTAKGDLFTYSTAPARLAVGNDGETIVADSSTSTGLRYQANFAAGKNKIINGDFGIWQRGTSITATAWTFTADRWATYGYAVGTTTVSQQTFTPGTAPVAGYEGSYFARVNSTNTRAYLETRLEDVRTFAGQTVTLSFWAKSASAQSTEPLSLTQFFGTGGSSAVGGIGTNTPSFTTSWARYSYTFTMPSISGKTIGTGSYVSVEFRGVINNNLDLWGVQLEAGNTATAFQTATGTLQGELAACQRYYQRIVSGGAYASVTLMGAAQSTTFAYVYFPLKTSLRVTPSSVDFSAVGLDDGVNAVIAATNVDSRSSSPEVVRLGVTVASGATVYRPYGISSNNNAAGYVGVSAEL